MLHQIGNLARNRARSEGKRSIAPKGRGREERESPGGIETKTLKRFGKKTKRRERKYPREKKSAWSGGRALRQPTTTRRVRRDWEREKKVRGANILNDIATLAFGWDEEIRSCSKNSQATQFHTFVQQRGGGGEMAFICALNDGSWGGGNGS